MAEYVVASSVEDSGLSWMRWKGDSMLNSSWSSSSAGVWNGIHLSQEYSESETE